MTKRIVKRGSKHLFPDEPERAKEFDRWCKFMTYGVDDGLVYYFEYEFKKPKGVKTQKGAYTKAATAYARGLVRKDGLSHIEAATRALEVFPPTKKRPLTVETIVKNLRQGR